MKVLAIFFVLILCSGCSHNMKGTKTTVDPLANVDRCKLYVVSNGLGNPFQVRCPKNRNEQIFKVSSRR